MGAFRYLLENPAAVAEFRAKYNIPENVQIRLDNLGDPLDLRPSVAGWTAFPLIVVVEGGVRFPLHPFLKICLGKWNLAPCQLMPNGYKIIMGVAALNRILGTNLGVHDIEEVYNICKSATIENLYFLWVKAHKKGSWLPLRTPTNTPGTTVYLFAATGSRPS